MRDYRIFYELRYCNDRLDYEENIKAVDDWRAVKKARRFVKKMNDKRKEETRAVLIKNGVSGAHLFTDEQLLVGSCFVLVCISEITKTLVQVRRESLRPISVVSKH